VYGVETYLAAANTLDLDARAVDQQMQRALGAAVGMFTATQASQFNDTVLIDMHISTEPIASDPCCSFRA